MDHARNIPERDWRLLRSLHNVALDRFCSQIMRECATVIRDDKATSHSRYLRLFKLLRARDRDVAIAFNDMRRSRAIQRLASLIDLELLTDAELSQFTAETRESATALADIWAPKQKNRRSYDAHTK